VGRLNFQWFSGDQRSRLPFCGMHGKVVHSLADCFFHHICVKVSGKVANCIRWLAESLSVVFQAATEGGGSLASFEADGLISAVAVHVSWQF
jgi:hypothetical protein